MSLAEAREKRDAAKKLLRQGFDPFEQDQEQKQVQKRALEAARRAELEAPRREAWTVAWLIEQFSEHELPVIHKKPGWGKALLRTHVGARLGPLSLGELTSARIWECLDPLRARQPATARHVYGLIRKVSAFAVRHGYLEADPAATIERKTVARKPSPRQRVLSDDEIRQLWFKFGDGRVSRSVWLALRLLLVSGQRRGEVMRARRSEFDLRAQRWLIPAEHLGKKKAPAGATPHLVPLSALAVSIVRELLEQSPDSEWLLPSPDDAKKAMDERALNRAITRKNLGWSPHDLRRTVRTRLSSLGVTAIVAERVIGHELPELIAVYDVHAYEAEKRNALKKWAGELRRILKI